MTVTEPTPQSGTAGNADQRPVEHAAALRADDPPADAELVEEELLVEEISIDGMCGVY